MVVHMVMRRPVPVPAPQVRVVWQGVRSGDTPEARWTDGSGQEHRWSGTRGVPWLQRDALREGEEWKINLPGVPADVPAVSLFLSSPIGRTVGLMVQRLSGDPNAAVLHPGAALAPGAAVEVLEFHRSGPGWQVVALDIAESADSGYGAPPGPPSSGAVPTTPGPEPVPGTVPTGAGPMGGWSGPVTDAPAPRHRADDRTVQVPTPPPGRSAAASPTGAPGARSTASAGAPSTARWSGRSTTANHLDQGPQVPIPDRLASAVDAARSTGAVRRARVATVVDLSASMYPWIASGILADVLTAMQAVAGAAQRASMSTRFLPDGTDLEIALDAEPGTELQEHLRAVGLRTGDRDRLVQALTGPATGSGGGSETVTLVVSDDPSLAAQAGPGTTAVIVGADPGDRMVGGDHAVAVGGGPVDVPRLARELAQRCFTTERR